LKIVYRALVRPILEYGCVVWDPRSANNSKQQERVQNRFLRFASYLLKIPCPSHCYSLVANNLSLSILAYRRHFAGIRFIKGILDSLIECSKLLSLISFKVPQRLTLSNVLFYAPHASTNYLANDSMRRLIRNASLDVTLQF